MWELTVNDDTIICPNCGHEFPMSAAITAEIEKRAAGRVEEAAKAREQQLLKSHEAELAKARQDAAAKAEEELKLELGDVQSQLNDKAQQLEESRRQELTLRRKERELIDRVQEADLEIERRLGEEREALELGVAERLSEQHHLDDLKKDKQLQDLQRQIEVLKQKASQGSQQTQGEVAELDIEASLVAQFPIDAISPVPKGVRGADVVHCVCDVDSGICGTIVWEIKNTKNWSDGWLQKLRDDQRRLKAEIAVLVSAALPEGVHRIAFVDGVWVCDHASALGLAAVLRSGVVQVARAHAAAEGRDDKMEALYGYLTGNEFRQRTEAVVEAFVAMKDDLAREQRSVESLWAKREKQIDRALSGIAGMYGDMQGIVGASLPKVTQLEIPAPDSDGRKETIEESNVDSSVVSLDANEEGDHG